jgi:SSS family solute:Na+ symporter
VAVSFTSFCILFYAYLGGIRAVILTDAIQAFLFGAILFGGSFALYNSFSHPAELAQSIRNLDEGMTTFDPSRIGVPLTLMAMWGFGYVLTPHMWQRIYMTSSARNLGRGIVAGSVLALIVVAIPSLFIGLAARSSGLEVVDTDKLMVAVFLQHANWMLPLLMLGAVAAGMSTVDSQLLTASSIVIHDLGGAKASARSSMRGRFIVFVGVVLLWALSLSSLREGAIVLLASKGIGIALLLLVPLLGGLASARPSTAAGVGSLIAGGAVLSALELGAIKAQIPLGFGFPIAAVMVQFTVYAALHWITAMAKGGRRSARIA